MERNTISKFVNNMLFMFHRSWRLSKEIYFIVILQSGINIVQPFIMLIIPKYILDELAGLRRPDITIKYVVLYAAITIIFHIATLIMNKYMRLKSIECSHNTQMDNQKKWLYMNYEDMENGQIRDIAGRAIEKLDPYRFIKETVCGFITNAIHLGGYIYIIASIHPLVIAIILIMIAINALIAKKLNLISYEYQPLIATFSRRYAYIYDMMLGVKGGQELRINGASRWLRKKFDIETAEYMKHFEQNQNKQFRYDVLTLVIGFVQTIVIYGYCAALAISGGITIGSFSVFLGAVTAFTNSFSEFVKRFPAVALLSKYVDDYRMFLKIAERDRIEQEVIRGDNPTNGKYDIEFVNVSFKYPNTDNYVLKNINIKIKNGERLSIVGYNGAGKSTFIKLLVRLYEPTEGKILVGGIDINKIEVAEYRKLLAIVFQDYQLFWLSSIRDNIILNNKCDEERFQDAVYKSGLSERIPLLKNGYNTVLECIYDEEGVKLSGGEEQKVACARAYYKESHIVILDEPTSALDPIAETMLYERFNSIISEKTAIYISHRLSSVKFCDSIAVFVEGNLVERGTHSELMKKNCIYADMFRKQAHYYVKKDMETEEGKYEK